MAGVSSSSADAEIVPALNIIAKVRKRTNIFLGIFTSCEKCM